MKLETEHLGVKVPAKLNDKINKAVSDGEYATKSDVVRTALRLLFKEVEN